MITVYRVSDTSVSMTTLRWAVRILFAQAAAVTVLAVLVIITAATSKGTSTASVVATPLITIFFAAVFGGLGFALHQLRAWARGPAIVMEMLLVPIGFYAISGSLIVGGVIMLSGLAGAGLLLAPSTRGALGLPS